MITCHVTYKIDPEKVAEFEVYASAWIPLVERFGGSHHGYFLPHEGPNDLAFAAFSFTSLAAYESYRTESSADPDCKAAYDFAVRTRCILRYDRHFLRPVLEGDASGVRDQQV
ncbi:NIPSNAP protein [Jannaschia faecimaris]|uniref:NIPSNAP protein n=1 Tax=Jannaschia faecimaris TaxID=1244108 RepID=A0A1H3NPN3_9RHOB|nr:NIPSNAP family protein [Jannaschia faecimaris]SDY90129.1 NIPSNAP protein [Jannaschia faecimaris]